MTLSAQIIETVRLEIRKAAHTITDPRELFEWLNARDIGISSLSAASGASIEGCIAKSRAMRKSTTREEYERLSVPLTQENFAGRAGVWGQDRPTSYLLRLMAEALDNQPATGAQKGLIEMCYEDILQRDSDGVGFKHYKDRRDAGGPGNSTLDIVRDIYLSPEAVALRREERG